MTASGAGATVAWMAGAARKKASTGTEPGPLLGPIKIQVNRSIRGATYGLDGDSRRAIQAHFPGLHAAPSVYVAFETEEDFERIHGKIWRPIALVLTGLPESKLEELGVVLFDAVTQAELARPFR